MLLAAGGCVNLFRPRSVGEGQGRAWYPVWNAGSIYAMAAEAGAEMTMMENRFVPACFKDGYGSVGAWFLLFKAKAVNAYGEDYMVKNKEMLNDYPPYGQAAVPASCLRNHLMLKEMKDGHGPIYMNTVTAMAKLKETLSPREVKHLESEAWEDFLDMCIGQCGIWVGENIEPDKKMSELMPTEPYLLGSHSGCCGINQKAILLHMSVDDYLRTCTELGREPQKSLKGQFNVRIPPALHKAAILRALADGVFLNDVTVRALEAYVNVPVDINHVETKNIRG